MLLLKLVLCLSIYIQQTFSSQYSTDQLRSLLSYDCSTDGSIEVRGVPDGYTLTVISTSCTVYLTSPGEYSLPTYCKIYDYWGYNHGYPSRHYRSWRDTTTSGYYRTTRYWYSTTRYWYTSTQPYWYQSTTLDYYGEVDIAVSHATHSGIIGGKDHHEFRLICDGIHTEGKLYRVSDAVRDVTNPSGAPPTLSYRRRKQLRAGYYNYPSLRITDERGRDVDYTHSGQLMYLLVSSNDPRYVIRPENCSAQDGYWWSSNRNIELFNVHHSGCLLEPYLMEMFTSIGHGQSSVRAPVYSFHFTGGSDYVSFICNVRICSKSSSNCDLSICKSKRASRDVSEEGVHTQEELSVSVRVGPASGGRKLLWSPMLVALLVFVSHF
ncbi:uncharacterized protein LOC125665748 [Ostrea edulis]|uniref:uncharacterized protein LOC125665748 n=1 Tax=Ostrea edulis TaxID=37623 RepID=UPI0024AEFB91|nr:uncharacterized protein LOC125665748 [Ostrea edulis]